MKLRMVLIFIILTGCTTIPTKNMVELPLGARILTIEESILLDGNFRSLAVEILRLRSIATPMGKCYEADYHKDFILK